MKNSLVSLLFLSLLVSAQATLANAYDPGTSFFFPTAVPRDPGVTLAKGSYLLGWQFERQFSKGFAAGIHTTVPIGGIAIGPQVKQSLEVADNFYIGVGAAAGVGASLIETRDTKSATYYAGGIMSSFDDGRFGFSVGTFMLGGRIGTYDHVFLADVNTSFRVSQKAKLMLDVFSPLGFYNKDDNAFDWGAATYGFRFHGESIYGDVGFLIPISSDTRDILRYLPLGIPTLSLGIYI